MWCESCGLRDRRKRDKRSGKTDGIRQKLPWKAAPAGPLWNPARLKVEGGEIKATIVWGSSNYDDMKVDGRKFDLVSAEENSRFEIPVNGFDWRIPVIADTIAMSEPHEIEYTLTFDSQTLKRAE